MGIKYLSMLLMSVIILTSCKETPSSTTTESTTTILEVRNNSGNDFYWFVYNVTLDDNQIWHHGHSNYEIRHTDKGIISFTEEMAGGDLNDVIVRVTLQAHNESVHREVESLTLDFKLGERRVVRVDCTVFRNEQKECNPIGLSLVLVE